MPPMARQLRDVPAPMVAALDRIARQASPKVAREIRAAIAKARIQWRALRAELSPQEIADLGAFWDSLRTDMLAVYGVDGAIHRALVSGAKSAATAQRFRYAFVETRVKEGALAWLESTGTQRITRILATTRAAIRAEIERSITGPKSLRSLADAIVKLPGLGLDARQLRAFERLIPGYVARVQAGELSTSQMNFALEKIYGRKLRYRARRIAVTEARNAVNAGQDMALRAAVAEGQLDGERYELEWLARVINACPICIALDGTRRPLEGGVFRSRPIESGTYAGQELEFERPGAHPNCACATRTVAKGSPIDDRRQPA